MSYNARGTNQDTVELQSNAMHESDVGAMGEKLLGSERPK